MGKRLELQIEDASTSLGYYHFDVEGNITPSLETAYNVGNPPTVAEVREVWEFAGVRLVSSDDTVDTLWTSSIAALRSALFERAAHPTYVRIVADPRSAASENAVFTLGPTGGYEGLRIEEIRGGPDPDVPEASWSRTASWTIVASAVKKLPDATTGIAILNQRTQTTYDEAGLRTLTWTTEITTQEGTSAITKAQTYARIPASALGGDHAYQTNGPDGIDFEPLDADEINSRTPTHVVAVSTIKQFGEAIGATDAQTSPGTYLYWYRTRREADYTETTYFAEAVGQNAAAYVASKAPTGDVTVDEAYTEPTGRRVSHLWIKRTDTGSAAGAQDEFRVRIVGASQVELWRQTTGLQPAHEDIGALTWWVCVVDVATKNTGSEEFTLPGLLSPPWALQRHLSSETLAEPLGQRGADPGNTRYVRHASLVYYSATPPDTGGRPSVSILEELRKAARVKSYGLV